MATPISRFSSFALVAVSLTGCTQESDQPWMDTIVQEALTNGQINGGSLPAKTVVLTYDDGPDEHTLELATYLAENGVRATFFVNGRRFCKMVDADGKCMGAPDTRPCSGAGQANVANPKFYPESLLDQLVSLGHRIANHTQDHCHLPAQTNVENLIWEVKATQDILDRHICDNVYLFRAPYGEWNGTVVSRLNSMMGFNKIIGPINWDIDGNDWDCWRKGTSPEACANRYMGILNGRANQNGIFLMHDRPEFNVTYEGPLLMTKILVPRLKAAGFKFATMDEVLRMPPRDAGVGCPMQPAADAGSGPAPSDAGAGTDTGAPVFADASGSTPPAEDASGRQDTAGGGAPGGAGGKGGSTAGGGATGGEDETGGAAGSGKSAADPGGCALARAPGSSGAAPLPLLIAIVALGLRRWRRRA